MSSGEDIQDLIQQLQDLQIQQAALLIRLARANSGSTTAQRSNTVPPDEIRELVVGDRVRILNPGLLQANRGVIVKIGSSRVTVQTRAGSKIIRAHKNVIIENE
jgi:dsDNA-specific endonuclease/ATPase MutS2